MATNATMLQTIHNLEVLELPDDQPHVEAMTATMTYVFPTTDRERFDDSAAFSSNVSAHFAEETSMLLEMYDTIKTGGEYSTMLYTYRGCSRAIPQVKSNEQANRLEIYEKTIEVLEPEVARLKALKEFNEQAILRFCRIISHLLEPNRQKLHTASQFLLVMARVLHTFSVLDSLKNMKACLNNDFSFYKRAFGLVKKNQMTDQIIMENQSTNMFLAQQNTISDGFKDSLEKIPGYEEIISQIIHAAAEHYEAQLYVLPEEKHMLLNAMAFGLFLMDGKQSVGIFKNKKLRLESFARLFKLQPVVPLVGDLQITLAQYIHRCPHFDAVRWSQAEGDTKVDPAGPNGPYNILASTAAAKSTYGTFVAELTLKLNELTRLEELGNGKIDADDLGSFFPIVQRCFVLLSSWSNSVIELHAWKLSHPSDRASNRDCPEDAEQYERAIRYNYSSAEKFALIEMIAMIKGLSSTMSQHASRLSTWVNEAIHTELQTFIYGPLTELTKYTTKKKKKSAETLLAFVHEACADVVLGMKTLVTSSAKRSKSKKEQPNMTVQVAERVVGPGNSQLYIVRAILEIMCPGKGGKKGLFDKELKSDQLAPIEAFVTQSFFYPYLLDFSNTLLCCSDLPQLWYREFFLELTMGGRIQFPIEMSLPWILTDHILETSEPSMMEYIFYPLDLYNSAANYALHHLRKQFMYDEIEAEVNLCFDQFVFKLADKIFTYYSTQAAVIMIDKGYQMKLELNEEEHGSLHLTVNRYCTLLKQRHVRLIGRSLNVAHLLQERLNTSLKKSLDIAISRYESGDLTGIVRLECHFENARLTHDLLTGLGLSLDPFDSLLDEVNESTSVSSFHGRIVLHTLWELAYDFVPNFCFNSTTQRFVRTKISFVDDTERSQPPKGSHFGFGSKALNNAFGAIHNFYGDFIGQPHMLSLLHVLGVGNMPLIMDELVKNISGTVKDTLAPYVFSLLEGLPTKLKLPIFDYGSAGALGFFQLQLQPVLTYRELKTEVFQGFREIGNALIFLNLLERSLNHKESFQFLQTAPFLGILPAPFKENPEMIFTKNLAQVTNPDQMQNAIEAERASRRIWADKSLFKSILGRLDEVLPQIFFPAEPANGIMVIEECREFYHLWSALQFAFCTPGNQHEFTPDDLFGEGLQWGGIAIIYLLGQHRQFEAFDFAYHIAKINCVDQKDENVAGMSLKGFVSNANKYKRRNLNIIALLSNYYPKSSQAVLHFDPPTFVES